ncbi:MAG: response regulator [Alphaproteobacteria bacterium]|nr:response regulator [Alphaproteobacteria bacterium]
MADRKALLSACFAAVGAGLVLVGMWSAGAGFWPILSAVTGVSMMISVSAIAGVCWLGQRRLRRDLAIFAALHGDADDSTFLVDGTTMRLLWQNRQAAMGGRVTLHEPASLLLADVSADPASLAMRLHEKAHAQGRAEHSVALIGHDWRLRVRPAGHGRMLWQISDTKHADPRDALPFQMLQTEEAGRILYASPSLMTPSAPVPRRVSDLFEQPLPEPGTIGTVVECATGQRHRGLRLVAPGGADTLILLDQDTATADPDDSFDALKILPVAIGLIDKNGFLTRVNEETRRLLRLRHDAVPRFCDLLEGLGRPVGEWLSDIRSGRLAQATEVLRAANPSDDVFLQVSLRPYGTDGELLAIMHDATEFKALEAKFTQSQKMQAIGQLAGGIAHDFNNLLTAISGHCDLILLRHDRSDIDYPDLMQIQQNTNRAAALVRQLLAFSRKQTLQFETLDLHDMLADAIHLLNRLVGERVTLTLRYGNDMPAIRSDKRQLEQVLMNLVVNARDAMPIGGEVVIETEHCALPDGLKRDRATLAPGDYAIIRVRDEGVGMAPATLAKVFDPFFSTKRQGEGTGLGLSTVYGIVKQSGGFIFVDSVEGQGTTFSIYFAAQPAQAAPAPSAVTAQAPTVPKAISGGVKRSTVLLVEDEAPVRSFAARALQLQGHDVLEADSGEAALEILTDPDVRPDIFVTDVIMPGLDGPGWVAQVRDRFPDTPIVFMSGYAEDSRVAAQSRFGQAVFIGKPFSLSEFARIVNEQVRAVTQAA